jgi:hypothetical protein
MDEKYRRYDISQDRALSVMGCASVALSSLLAWEKHEREAATLLENLRSEIGISEEGDANPATHRDAQAVKAALSDQVRALRKDLADLAADAASVLPPPEGASTIVIPKELPPPQLDLPTPLALAQFERWYVQGTAKHMRDAAQNAEQLVRHLRDSDDPDTMNLCSALEDFVRGVSGQQPPGRH